MANTLKRELISQRFGARNRAEIFSGGFNRGTDFAVPTGTPVSVPKGKWKVVESFGGAKASGVGNKQRGINRGYGNSVLLENLDTGEKLRFSHLSRVGVKSGDILEEGKTIALTGATGNVAGKTGQHLDLEYYNKGGQLADVLGSDYAGKTIMASAKQGGGSVGGSATANMDTSFTAKADRFRKEAKKHGWSDSRIDTFLDEKATVELARKGKISPEDITDESTRLGVEEALAKEGIEPTPKPAFKESEVIDRTKEYLTDIDTYKSREEALTGLERFKPVMEKEGVDVNLIQQAIDKKFPAETFDEEEPAKGMFANVGYEVKPGVKGFFTNLFEKEKQLGKKYWETMLKLNPLIRKTK